MKDKIKIEKVPYKVYWECNKCKILWFQNNKVECVCGNGLDWNSTKRKKIDFYELKELLEELNR